MDERSPAALFVNTHSRHGGAAYQRVVALLQQAGVPLALCREVDEPAELPGLVAEAIAGGCREVLVGGGDGTLSSVIASFVDSPAALGILPVGTGNFVAHALGIHDLAGAVAAIAGGRVAEIDVCRAGERYFLNSLSLGLAAAFRRDAPRGLKHRLGVAAYAVAAARAFAHSQPFFALLTIDGQDIAAVCHDVVATNGRFIGPHLLAGPHASIADHELIVFTLGGRSHLRLAIQAVKVWLGLHAGNPRFHFRITDALTIATDPPQRYVLDGERGGWTPVTVRLLPNAVKVFAPADFRG